MIEPDPSSPYELTWEYEAIDRLATLVKQYPDAARGVVPAVYRLAVDPWPAESTRLGGSGTYRRLPVGYFRVLYAVTEDPPLVRIILVGRDDQAR